MFCVNFKTLYFNIQIFDKYILILTSISKYENWQKQPWIYNTIRFIKQNLESRHNMIIEFFRLKQCNLF